ncbi:MAG: DNA repair protein RecO [Hyphomicrobiales bacterium]|nr:DNA repair protein RecO [Hyphomicrobiales bacterium]
MQWTDDAIVLSARPFGENAAIAEVFARSMGRCLGLVHGGRSRRIRPALQAGNLVKATWRARLEDSLGGLSVELAAAHATRAMDDPAALAVVSCVAFFARLLPERDPHPELFDAALAALEQADAPGGRREAYAQFEFKLLQELGFGLDLTECAATGARENLVYVSPKSGRAVSAAAGAPYADKLLPLPPHLLTGRWPDAEGAKASLALTGHFIEKHALAPAGLHLPAPRALVVSAKDEPRN